MIVSGSRLKRTEDGGYLVRIFVFTPCQCNPGEPHLANRSEPGR